MSVRVASMGRISVKIDSVPAQAGGRHLQHRTRAVVKLHTESKESMTLEQRYQPLLLVFKRSAVSRLRPSSQSAAGNHSLHTQSKQFYASSPALFELSSATCSF